jgi:hypothetical protein
VPRTRKGATGQPPRLPQVFAVPIQHIRLCSACRALGFVAGGGIRLKEPSDIYGTPQSTRGSANHPLCRLSFRKSGDFVESQGGRPTRAYRMNAIYVSSHCPTRTASGFAGVRRCDCRASSRRPGKARSFRSKTTCPSPLHTTLLTSGLRVWFGQIVWGVWNVRGPLQASVVYQIDPVPHQRGSHLGCHQGGQFLLAAFLQARAGGAEGGAAAAGVAHQLRAAVG